MIWPLDFSLQDPCCKQTWFYMAGLLIIGLVFLDKLFYFSKFHFCKYNGIASAS